MKGAGAGRDPRLQEMNPACEQSGKRVLSGHLTQTPPCPVVESEAQRDGPRSPCKLVAEPDHSPSVGTLPLSLLSMFPNCPYPMQHGNPPHAHTLQMPSSSSPPSLYLPQAPGSIAAVASCFSFPPPTPYAIALLSPSWPLFPPSSQPPVCEFLIYNSDLVAPLPFDALCTDCNPTSLPQPTR